jgi:hypothetical protein
MDEVSSCSSLPSGESQSRIRAAMTRGFQTRDAEMALGRMLGGLADR